MSSRTRVSAADIARIAGVRRSAVSNWRTRYADFPQPVGNDPDHPQFDRRAVKAWIARHNQSKSVRAAAALPPAMADPLLALLRRAHARTPGVWLLHEQLLDAGLATAALIRRLAAAGTIERRLGPRYPQAGRGRTLVRLSFAEDVVDLRDVEQRANAVLAVVGHAVRVLPGRGTAAEFTTVKITYRGFTYTGYHHSRPWTVHAAPIA